LLEKLDDQRGPRRFAESGKSPGYRDLPSYAENQGQPGESWARRGKILVSKAGALRKKNIPWGFEGGKVAWLKLK